MFKSIWIWSWQWTRTEWLLTGIEFADPGPYRFAQSGLGLIFDQRRTLPSVAEAHWFDALLVLGSGLQWALVALTIRAIQPQIRGSGW